MAADVRYSPEYQAMLFEKYTEALPPDKMSKLKIGVVGLEDGGDILRNIEFGYSQAADSTLLRNYGLTPDEVGLFLPVKPGQRLFNLPAIKGHVFPIEVETPDDFVQVADYLQMVGNGDTDWRPPHMLFLIDHNMGFLNMTSTGEAEESLPGTTLTSKFCGRYPAGRYSGFIVSQSTEGMDMEACVQQLNEHLMTDGANGGFPLFDIGGQVHTVNKTIQMYQMCIKRGLDSIART